jgi:hypothetical protein
VRSIEGCVSAGAARVGEIGLTTTRRSEVATIGEDKETLREVESIGTRLAKESTKEMAQA